MAAFIPYLVLCQALGAFVGTFTAIWSELVYIRAMRDGKIDTAERAHLDVIAKGLRFGMTLLLLSSFALVVVDYELKLPLQPALRRATGSLSHLHFLLLVYHGRSTKDDYLCARLRHYFSSWWFLFSSPSDNCPHFPLVHPSLRLWSQQDYFMHCSSTVVSSSCAKGEVALGCIYENWNRGVAERGEVYAF